MATFKRWQVTGKARLKILEGLFLNGNFAYENQNKNYKEYLSLPNRRPIIVMVRPHGKFLTGKSKLMEIFANYDKDFGEDHRMAPHGRLFPEERKDEEGFGAKGYNYYDDSLGWNDIGMANSWDTDPVWGKLYSKTRMISFYGRANYSYKSKYLLQAAVRRDGASTFGSNNKWATFPSASVAWRVTGKTSWNRAQVGYMTSSSALAGDRAVTLKVLTPTLPVSIIRQVPVSHM